MDQMVSAFNSAAWTSAEVGACRASWGIVRGSGRYYGQWYCDVNAAIYDTTRIDTGWNRGVLTHVASGSFTCEDYYFYRAAGAGEARVAVLAVDSLDSLPATLSELEALDYVLVTGTGRYAFPKSHFERHRYICTIAYLAGLMPPTADGYDWGNDGYPTAQFSLAISSWPYDYSQIDITLETADMATAALEEVAP
jgi:hypothetical protein